MERQNENGLQNTNESNEVYVTNAAIKTTDVLWTIGAGAFALAGFGCLWNVNKRKKQLKAQDDFEARIISNLISEGASQEEIENAKRLLAKIR